MKLRLSIPNDWDGKTWRCYRIWWPDSTLYTAILRGFLSYLIRGRAWDERSGSIIAAQSVGIEIWDRNKNLDPCRKCSDTTGGGGNDGTGGGVVIESEEDMGQVVTDVRVENGVLRVYFGPCCYHDYAIGVASPTLPDPSDPDAPQLPDGVDEATACIKASALVDAHMQQVQFAFDQAQDHQPPFTALVKGQDLWGGADFGDIEYWTAYTAIASLALLGLEEETQPADFVQRMKCKFAELIAPGSQGVTPDEYEDCRGALKSLVLDEFTIGNYPLSFGSMQSAHVYLFKSYGDGDVRKKTAYLTPVGDEDCSCPDEPLPPSIGNVIWTTYVEKLTAINAEDGDMTTELSDGRRVLGVTWAGTESYGGEYTNNQTIFGIDCLVDISAITLRFEGMPPTAEWDASGPHPNWLNINSGVFNVEVTAVDWALGPDYADATFTFAAPGKPTRWGYMASNEARYPGQLAPNPFSIEWTVRIVAYT